MFVSSKIEFLVISCTLSEREGVILVDDAPDLHDSSSLEFVGITFEFDNLDLGLVFGGHEKGGVFNFLDSTHESYCLADELIDLVL